MQFSKNQSQLAQLNLDESIVTLLTHRNKIIQCISSCKENIVFSNNRRRCNQIGQNFR